MLDLLFLLAFVNNIGKCWITFTDVKNIRVQLLDDGNENYNILEVFISKKLGNKYLLKKKF